MGSTVLHGCNLSSLRKKIDIVNMELRGTSLKTEARITRAVVCFLSPVTEAPVAMSVRVPKVTCD